MHSVHDIIDLALREDIGSGDITTDSLIDSGLKGEGIIKAKQTCVLSGLKVAGQVFETLDPYFEIKYLFSDGDEVEYGDALIKIKGSLKDLLYGERVALNFLQRMSGISTITHEYTSELKGHDTRLVDTRKTTPGWRALEKYAVRAGGGYNHRMALYDGVLIKDNHIAVSGGVKNAVEMVRSKISHLSKIEVEVSDMAELEEALSAGADIIMLDNMNLAEIKKAVKHVRKRAIVEVSGNVTKDRLKDLAETGVDIISSGALTHQAVSVDMSMMITAD